MCGLPKRYKGLSLFPDWSDSPRKKRKLDEVEYPRISCKIAMRWKDLANTDLETMRFCEHVAKRKMMEYRSKLIAYNVGLVETKQKQINYDPEAEPSRNQFKSLHHDVVEGDAIIASSKKCTGIRVGADDLHQFFRDVDLVDEPRTPSPNNKNPSISTVISPCQSTTRQVQDDDHNSHSPSQHERTDNITCDYVDMTDEEIYEVWYKLFEEDDEEDNNTDSARSDDASHSNESATKNELNRPFCFPCSDQCDDDDCT